MSYDAAVIGAGHNGLVAANYLARAGQKVVVLETRDIVGGACVSEELIPGAQWSSCAFIAGLIRPEVVEELELERHGLEMYQSDVLNFSLFADGSHLFLWKELDRTLREIERYSTHDAKRFLDFGLRLKRFADIVRPWLLQPAPLRSEVMGKFERLGEQELFNEFVLLSARDLLDRYFESEHLKGLLTFFAVVSIWGGPSTPGTGYVYGHHSWGEFKGQFGQYGFVRGGMGGITQALANAARAHGVEIRTATPVARVLIEHGKARGVVLENGEVIRSATVISNADPKRSLLELVEPSELAADFRTAVQNIDQRGSMARIHLLIDELPAYLGFDATEGPQHRGHQLLGASVANYELAWEAQRRGVFPDEYVIEAVIQSTTDPTLAPAGQHTLTLGVQQLPYELAEGTWDDVRESWADRVVEDLCRYAPNLRDHILGRYVITPLDLERTYGITGGNIFHGQMFLDQLFAARPLPELASYRTPIGGYYLCGVGMHPGGGVMGASGHNAAQVVLADRGAGPAAVARAPGPARSGGLVGRLMQSESGRRAGYQLARQKAFRPLAKLAARGGGARRNGSGG
jgi:phytoene dehydrogenase-like protein